MPAYKKSLLAICALFLFGQILSFQAVASENVLLARQIPENIPAQLKSYIAQLQSPLPDERILGLKGISKYWDLHPGSAIKKDVIRIIASLESFKTVDPLIRILRVERDPEVRALLSEIIEDYILTIVLGLNIKNSPSQRRSALNSLGEIKDPLAAELYLSALKVETDSGLRRLISGRLKNSRDPIVKKPFKEIVMDKEESIAVRRNVAVTLRNFKDPALIEPYVSLLGDSDSFLRFLGRDSLKEIGLPESVGGLIETVQNHADNNIRLRILKGLSHIDNQTVTRLFSDVVMNTKEDTGLRSYCFTKLFDSDKTEFLTPLLLINDPEPAIRAVAARTLEQTNLPEVDQILLNALKTEVRPEVRETIYEGLGRYLNRKILEMSLNQDPVKRSEAARDLGSIGRPESVEALVLALDEERDSDVRLAIVESLVETRDRRIVLPLIRVLKNRDENTAIKLAALGGVSGISDSKILELLVSILQHREPLLRRAAVVALRANSNERVMGALLKLFKKEPARSVRFEIIENLKIFMNPRVTTLFRQVAGDRSNDPQIRRSALAGLKERWKREFRELFIASLQDEDHEVRRLAIDGLIAEGSISAGEPLLAALLIESDPENRRRILAGLHAIKDPLTLKQFSEILWGRNRSYTTETWSAIKSLYSPLLSERANAADYLSKRIGDSPEFVNYLAGILNDNNKTPAPRGGKGELTTPARIALKNFTETEGVPLSLISVALQMENDPVLSANAAAFLGKTADPGAVKILVEALKSESSPVVREAIVKGLKKKRATLARDSFIKLLKDRSERDEIRIIAAEALGIYMGVDIVQPLLEVFRSEPLLQVKANIAIRLLGVTSKDNHAADASVTPVELGRDFFLKDGKEQLPLLLAGLLHHPSPVVRKNAAIVLRGADPKDVPEEILLSALKSEKDGSVRKEIVSVFAALKSRFMVVPFSEILADPGEEPDIRKIAATALQKLNVPFVYETFNRVLKDHEPFIRQIAVRVLLESGITMYENRLIGRLQDEKESEILLVLAKGLSGRKNPKALSAFIKIAENREVDIRIRQYCAKGLKKLGSWRESVPAFISLLDEVDPVLQVVAIKALIESRDPAAVDPLLGAMKREENSFMRGDIARGISEVLDSLVSGLEAEDDPVVRMESAALLGSIKYYVARDMLMEAWRVEKNPDVRLKILNGLKERRSGKLIAWFKQLLFDESEDDRNRVIAGRWILNNSDEVLFGRFRELLRESDSALRGVGVAGLEKFQDERAVRILIDLFQREGSQQARLRIVGAVKSFGVKDREVFRFLSSLFGDSGQQRELRVLAGQGLVGEQSEEMITLFVSALQDSDEGVREIAEKGLGQVPEPDRTLPLIMAMEDGKETPFKIHIIRLLAGNEDAGIIDPLLKVVHARKEPLSLRHEAAEALKGLTGERVAEAYISFLKDRDPGLRMISARGLQRVGSALAVTSILSALERERNPDVRRALTAGLNVKTALPLNPELELVLRDRSENISARRLALKKIIKFGALSEALLLFLQHQNEAGLLEMAISELARSDERRLARILMKSKDSSLRRKVAAGLMNSDSVLVKELFSRIVTDGNEARDIRKFTLSLYRKNNSLMSVDVFKKLLNDVDPEFSLVAKEELERLSSPDKKPLFANVLSGEKDDRNIEKPSEIVKLPKSEPVVDNNVSQREINFPPEVAEAVEGLDSDLSRERGAAAAKLGEFGAEYPEVIPLLLRMLGNDDAIYKVKKKKHQETTTPAREAVKALGKIGSPAIRPLLGQALSDDRLVRQYTVMALGVIEDERTVDELISLLDTEQNPQVRREITNGLKRKSSEKSVKTFLALLNDKSEFLFVRRDAAEYLSQRNSPGIVKSFSGLLKERDKRLRLTASEYFTKNSTEGVVSGLISALKRERVISIQVLLSEALKLSRDPVTIPLFINLLKKEVAGEGTEGGTVRKNMMEGLRFFKDPRALQTYIDALDDEDSVLREIAVKGLADLADPEGLAPLLDRLEIEREDDIRMAIILSIASFDEPIVVRRLVKIVTREKDPEFRRVAIRSLGESKDPDSTEPLILALKDPDPELQGAAIDALVFKKDTLAVDRLTEYSKNYDNDAELRERAEDGVRAITDPLLLLLTDKDPEKRESAARKLSIIRGSLIAEPFIFALKREKRESVKLAILKGLKEQKESVKVEPLLAVFSDKEEKIKVRRAAADGLKGRVTAKAVSIIRSGLSEKDTKMRQIVAGRVAESDLPEVIPLLIDAFHRENRKQNKVRIVEALKSKKDPLLIPFFSERASDKKEKYKVRLHAAEGLKNQNSPSSFEIFADLLLEKKSSLRSKGVEGLGELRDPLSIKTLLKLLESEKVGSVRFRVVEALSRFDSSDIHAPFLTILTNTNENFKLRKVVALNLEKHGVKEALDAFIAVLNGKDSAIQNIAVSYLLSLRDSRLVTPFITLLSDRDSVLRKWAVKGLLMNKDSRSLPPLIQAQRSEKDPNVKKIMEEGVDELLIHSGGLLMDGNLKQRRYVARELGKIEDARLLEISLESLENEKDFQVRNLLTAGLKMYDDPGVTRALITVMGDTGENVAVRTNAAEGLRRALVPEAFDAFSTLIKDPDPGLRTIAAVTVSEYRDKKSMTLLLSAMNTEKDPDVRVAISAALMELKDPEIMETLIKVLLDLYDDPNVRRNAASGLKYMKDSKTVEPFIKVMDDDDPVIRLTAVEGLNGTGDRRRVGPFVLRLASETEADIRIALTEGLKGVNDLSVVPALEKILGNSKELLKVRQNAAFGLSGITSGDVAAVFRKTVFDPDPTIRGVSAGALIKLNDQEMLRSVLSLLGSEREKEVRLRITEGLKGQKDPAVIAPMADTLKNVEEPLQIRRNAAETLSGIENPLVVEPLRAALKSDDSLIRLSAVRGLRLNNSPKLSKVFLEALKDGMPMVRYNATWAISDLRFLKRFRSAEMVVNALNIPPYLKNAVLKGTYSKVPSIRGMGVKAIKEKVGGYPSLIFFLVRMLGDGGSFYMSRDRSGDKLFVGKRAAGALVQAGERTTPALLGVLADEKSDLARINASTALLEMEKGVDGDHLHALLEKEQNPVVRTNLFRLVLKSDFAGRDRILREAFGDISESPETRQVAGVALLKKSASGTSPVMRAAMSDEDIKIREIASEFLMKTGGGENIPYFLKGLKDESPEVRYHAVLGLIRAQGFDNSLANINELLLPVGLKNALKRLYSGNPRTRGLAINFLGKADYPSVIPFLVSLLGDEAEYERESDGFIRVTTPAREAERALVRIGTAAASSLTFALQENGSDAVRIHAVKALVEINDPASLGALVQALKREKNSSIRISLSTILMSEKNNSELKDIFLDIINERKDHWQVRYNAIKALKGMSGAGVTDALLLALKDKDSVIRSAAAEGLIGSRNRKVLMPLIRALDDEYPVVRYNAAQALKSVRSRKLKKKLYRDIVDALNDLDPDVRQKAAETLGVLKAKGSKGRLLKALRDPEPAVRMEAVKALGNLDVSSDKDSEAILYLALNDSSRAVRDAAIETLFAANNSRIISMVYEAFQREEWSVRENAIAILKRLNNTKAVKYMVKAVSSKDKDLRLKLVEAFAYMGDGQIGVLISLVDDESVQVRRKVAWALGLTGSFRAFEPLNRLKADKDRQVRRMVADSFSRLRAYDSMKTLLDESHDYSVRKTSLEGMLRVNPGQQLLDALYNLLTDRDVRIRKIAALGLGKVGNQFSVEHLVGALNGEWSGIRNEAAISLGKLGDPLAINSLLNALKSGDAELRKNVSVALEKITDEEGRPTLEHWKGVRKKMFLSDARESGRLFVFPLVGAVVVLLLL